MLCVISECVLLDLSETAKLSLQQARWVELPVIASGSFLIKYVSYCQLPSTYGNILIVITSTEIPVRHIALK